MADTRAEKPASPPPPKDAERKTNDGESKPDFLRRVNMLPYQKMSMETAWAAINSAGDIIKSLHAPAPAPTAPASELQKALVDAVVKQMSADPLEAFVRMAALMREASPAANGSIAAGSAEDKLLSLLIERALNPPAPSRSPVAGLGAELERALPLLTPFITEALRNWERITAARRAIEQAGNQTGSST